MYDSIDDENKLNALIGTLLGDQPSDEWIRMPISEAMAYAGIAKQVLSLRDTLRAQAYLADKTQAQLDELEVSVRVIRWKNYCRDSSELERFWRWALLRLNGNDPGRISVDLEPSYPRPIFAVNYHLPGEASSFPLARHQYLAQAIAVAFGLQFGAIPSYGSHLS